MISVNKLQLYRSISIDGNIYGSNRQIMSFRIVLSNRWSCIVLSECIVLSVFVEHGINIQIKWHFLLSVNLGKLHCLIGLHSSVRHLYHETYLFHSGCLHIQLRIYKYTERQKKLITSSERHTLKSKAQKFIIIGHRLAIILLTKHI